MSHRETGFAFIWALPSLFHELFPSGCLPVETELGQNKAPFSTRACLFILSSSDLHPSFEALLLQSMYCSKYFSCHSC